MKTEKKLNRNGDTRGLHPNSLKNLKPNPGNNGRPKNEWSLTYLAREKLLGPCPYDPKGRTWRECLVERWLSQSLENVSYFNQLMDRLEGKVTQPISGPDGGPIRYQITVEDNETKQLTEQLISGQIRDSTTSDTDIQRESKGV